ncbi:hypothetical protein PIB30_112490, partial [Stylosanthes scabra]|nr:hypothetical protein [Stylosanthes scabra]
TAEQRRVGVGSSLPRVVVDGVRVRMRKKESVAATGGVGLWVVDDGSGSWSAMVSGVGLWVVDDGSGSWSAMVSGVDRGY